jgi:predicted nuclease of predicted toxin-antitoxin system
MKFLIDAQLPHRMVGCLASAGCDAVHTVELPEGNRTTDAQVIACADQEQRVVVTKDADFVNEHLLHGRPAKL